MASFNAGAIVEPLDYDFTTLKGPNGAASVKGLEGCKGTIAEPTSAQVRAFNDAAQAEIRLLSAELAKIKPGADMPDVGGLPEVLENMAFRGVSLSPEAVQRQCRMLSALCSGTPTAAQLGKLPHRILTEFAKWLSREVMDPEAVTGDGNAQALSLVSSAAG